MKAEGFGLRCGAVAEPTTSPSSGRRKQQTVLATGASHRDWRRVPLGPIRTPLCDASLQVLSCILVLEIYLLVAPNTSAIVILCLTSRTPTNIIHDNPN